ncbi:M28 family peptidase [candidate division KSB1 bacterium]
MFKRVMFYNLLITLILSVSAGAQITPYFQWSLLPPEQLDEIVGEASGETAWNTIMETGGYNKDRQPSEYRGTFYETQYVYDQLRLYGVADAQIVRFPGGEVWDAVKGELWEVSPNRVKLASYKDMTAMLVNGSSSADVTAELAWVGGGSSDEIAQADVRGKIVVTDGSVSSVHSTACIEQGALGVIAINNSRPLFDPLQLPWSRLGGRGGGQAKFGFMIPPREGQYLIRRLRAGQTITVHAQVETTTQPYDLQDIVCTIPGTDRNAGEVIFSAHLFEGYVKQGANDNKSGSAGILEAARVLHRLVEEGRLPRPRRTIRFLWGPEFSGTGPWVVANKDIMERTLCNINMDMVGEWLSLNQAFFCLMRTSYGNPHYINDVAENYFRYVGESNRERLQNRGGSDAIPNRIMAPTGSDEPFYYSIETHYGASDHEVFNDWGVQVPGVMFIAWPDKWYHTSGDRIDKSDPTQMKRVAVIGAATAYTIANADDKMTVKIAGEITSNGARRLGHQYIRGLEELNNATAATLAEAYKTANVYISTAIAIEKETLESVLELAVNRNIVSSYVQEQIENIDEIGKRHLSALETHMKTTAQLLGTSEVRVEWTELEQRAARIIPKPTPKIKENGYRGYQQAIAEAQGVSPQEGQQRGRGGGFRNAGELHLLIDGQHSALDIKNMLDAQNANKADMQQILDYLEILQRAGMIEM